jgi:hypothetical protein
VEDTKGMLDIVVSYYKSLFVYEDNLDINQVDDFWQD